MKPLPDIFRYQGKSQSQILNHYPQVIFKGAEDLFGGNPFDNFDRPSRQILFEGLCSNYYLAGTPGSTVIGISST